MLLFLLFRKLRGRADEVPSFRQFAMRVEILAVAVILMGVIYGIAEHASWSDSVWLVWQTITTVGYGDIPPKTLMGRFGVMACGVVSIILLSYMVSSGIDYREDLKRRRRQGLEGNKDTNSYLLVCCRDEEELMTFVTELRYVDANASICIVDDIMQELPPRVAHFPRISFVRGPILARETYTRAGIGACRQIIFFPHRPGHAASDATTQTLVSLAQHMVPKGIPIMHFLVDPKNQDLFEGLRSTPIYSDFAIFAAIQECQDRGSAEIFSTLMSNAHGANPKTFIPEKIVGWTWGQFVERALGVSRSLKIPVNPLALIQGGKSNPCPDMDTVIESGDSLSLIVHPGFQYSTFEQEVARIK